MQLLFNIKDDTKNFKKDSFTLKVSGQGAGDRVLPLFSLHSLWRDHDQVRLKFLRWGGGRGAWFHCSGRAT